MVPTKQGKVEIDIKLTPEHLGNLCFEILPAHALTGCDQVCSYYGIGKAKMLKVVKDSKTLSLLGNLDANFDDVLKEATHFMSACYSAPASDMSKARIKVWNTRTMKKTAKKATPLCSLPPPTAGFTENSKRAHLQTSLWRRALDDPPNVNATDFGWEKMSNQKHCFRPPCHSLKE